MSTLNRVPLRLRLTAVFAAAMAAILLGAGWFAYARVGSDLSRSLDDALRSRAQDLSALVRNGGSLETTQGTLIEQGESFAELVAVHGRVLDSTAPIGSTRLLTAAELARARDEPTLVNRRSVPGLDEPARMLALPVTRDRVLIVGATRENRAETLSSLLTAFLIGGPIALLLASLGGYLLAGAALRPIEAMRRRAAEISSSSLDERLPVPPARDEVARLGETLNAMLARLVDGLARERRFVTEASHELRTPLASLRTELELALRQPRTTAELEEAIRSAAAESDRLARIAEDLLVLARSEQGRLPLRREPVDAADILDTVAGRFAARARDAQRALSTCLAGEPVVVADRLRLEQALGNLVDNALRHGAGAVVLSTAARDGEVEFHVVDEGPGFSPLFLGHAFERFSRADDNGDDAGSGLGLAIVETVARAHGGGAHAANRTPHGADVWLTLPRAG